MDDERNATLRKYIPHRERSDNSAPSKPKPHEKQVVQHAKIHLGAPTNQHCVLMCNTIVSFVAPFR